MTVPQLVETMKKDANCAGAFEGQVASGDGGQPPVKKNQRQVDQNANSGVKKDGKAMNIGGLKARQAARGG